jgi:hypothetical protein
MTTQKWTINSTRSPGAEPLPLHYCITSLYGICTLSKASAGWQGLRGQMILRAMPAVALAIGRVTLAGQVEGDDPDERGYPGPPGWRLGVRLTTSPRKKLYLLWKLTISLGT